MSEVGRMTPEALAQAAEIMIVDRNAGGMFKRLPEHLRPVTCTDGYALQSAILHHRKRLGEQHAGWKIGCTVKAMQEMLGIPEPSGGAVMSENVHKSPAVLRGDDLCNPVAECELGVRLASDVKHHASRHDRYSIAEFVDSVFVAIEIAEIRHAEDDSTTVPEMIADDFFQKAVVVGDEISVWQLEDLNALTASAQKSGEFMGEASSSEVMGHPFEALAWLANNMADRGQTLRSGELVVTGSIVKAFSITAGDSVVCAISGIGEARLVIS